MLTVISLGAGVQSSTMALMAARGEITPMPDCAIFADTQAEPKAVYEYLDWLESQLPFPVYRVTAGSLRDDSLSGKRVASPPFFAAGGGMIFRQCTVEYKIEPIRKKLRELAEVKRGDKRHLVEQWIGISQDEIQRMRLSRDKWCANRFPLIEKRFTRGHCLEWLRDRQYPMPQKSACTFCPYHDNAAWREMRNNDPDSWSDAVSFDAAIRNSLPKMREGVFVHRSLVPLGEADISDPAESQQGMFDDYGFINECEGMCGV